jgi:hypothetical protein
MSRQFDNALEEAIAVNADLVEALKFVLEDGNSTLDPETVLILGAALAKVQP